MGQVILLGILIAAGLVVVAITAVYESWTNAGARSDARRRNR